MKGLLVFMSMTLLGIGSSQHLCNGFLPENDMRIPVNRFSPSAALAAGGLSQEQFNSVLDKVEQFYRPVIAAKGGNLVMNRLWTDETVNASAQRQGNNYVINMYGGLARFPSINEDGFLLVACHETGHHLGGAPKISNFFGMNDWASNEGQSDYFATLRCMRFLLQNEDNAKFVAETQVDAVLSQSCTATYSDVALQNLCMRLGMAGMNVSATFMALKKETTAPKFETPDTRQVDRVDDNHPATQCRLDTYFQGALCVHDASVGLSDSDATVGTCNDASRVGNRPRCWYSTNSGGGFPWPPRLSSM